MHWINHLEPIPIKKFGRKKKETDDESERLIIKVHEEQKLGARRLEKTIKFKCEKPIPYNRIHQVLLKNEQLTERSKNKHVLCEKQRFKFDTFADFVRWHSTVWYHESLGANHYLQTPEDAFWARLPDGCKLNIFFKRMQVEM